MQAQELWHMGLVAPRHVGSSRTRARTSVSCIGRQILNHCAPKGSPIAILNKVVRVVVIEEVTSEQTEGD